MELKKVLNLEFKCQDGTIMKVVLSNTKENLTGNQIKTVMHELIVSNGLINLVKSPVKSIHQVYYSVVSTEAIQF